MQRNHSHNVIDLTDGSYDEEEALRRALKESLKQPQEDDDEDLRMALMLSREDTKMTPQRTTTATAATSSTAAAGPAVEDEDIAKAIQLSMEEEADDMEYAAQMEEAIAASITNWQHTGSSSHDRILFNPFLDTYVPPPTTQDFILDLPSNNALDLKLMRHNLESDLGVRLDFVLVQGQWKLRVMHSDVDVASIAVMQLREIIAQPTLLHDMLHRLKEERLHIYIDHSNIFLGAQMILDPKAKGRDSVRRDPSIRLQIPALVGLVEGGRTCVDRLVFGSSTTASNPQLVRAWENLDYTVHLAHRLPGQGEQFVDDAIIAQINNAVLKFQTPPNPQHTLILMTGDGNQNLGRTNFLDCVDNALRRGWKVEVWSWRASTSRKYLEMAQHYGKEGVFKVVYLDSYRESITSKPKISNNNMTVANNSNMAIYGRK